MGPDGALWFTNSGNDSIGRITTSGVVTNYTNSGIAAPSAITTGPDGALWFTDFDAIGRITTSGVFSFYNENDGYFPSAITVGPDGALWVTSEGQSSSAPPTPNVIFRMTTSGVITDTYTVPDVPIGGLGGITSGPDGALWFVGQSGYDSGLIGRMTTTGAFTFYTDSSGFTPDEITTGPDGALWFTDTDGNLVGRITTAGAITNYTDPSIIGPSGIAAGPDGALWFANTGYEHQTATQGPTSIGHITTSGTVSSYGGPGVNDPNGIATGPDGALWFTNGGNNSIGRITTSGVITNYTDPSIDDPSGITTGPDGALWFTNGGNNSIGRITTSGVVSNYTDPSISNPAAITTGPDGALWFTNLGTNSIGRITTAGVVTNYTDPSISYPLGIAAGPDGALWFTNVQNNSIGRITTSGVVSNYTGTGIDDPEGITSGPDGALWFTNSLNDSIGRITTSGVVTNYPLSKNPLLGPTAITTGPDGALWFSNLRSIGRITTAGVITSYSAGGEVNAGAGSDSIAAGPDGALWFTDNSASIGRIVLVPPTTNVLVPGNGVSVSGTQALDAAASNAAKVSFTVTGGPDNDTVVSAGDPTIYGWLGEWNTSTLPNGSYTLESVATDTEGVQRTSTPGLRHRGQPTTEHDRSGALGRGQRVGHLVGARCHRLGQGLERDLRALRRDPERPGHRQWHPDRLRLVRPVEYDDGPQRAVQPGQRRRLPERAEWDECAGLHHGGQPTTEHDRSGALGRGQGVGHLVGARCLRRLQGVERDLRALRRDPERPCHRERHPDRLRLVRRMEHHRCAGRRLHRHKRRRLCRRGKREQCPGDHHGGQLRPLPV